MSYDEIHGSRIAAQRAAFLVEIERIEAEHSDFFKSRGPKYETEEQDHLKNHYQLRIDDNGSSYIGFFKDSELPADIRDKCSAAFARCFN